MLYQAGATAALIIDFGACSEDFQCGLLGKASVNGFIEQDGWYKWKDIQIPSGLVHFSAGFRLKENMALISMELDDVGLQFMIDED